MKQPWSARKTSRRWG